MKSSQDRANSVVTEFQNKYFEVLRLGNSLQLRKYIKQACTVLIVVLMAICGNVNAAEAQTSQDDPQQTAESREQIARFIERARQNLAGGRLSRAERYIQKALQIDPSDSEAQTVFN
ncbi:MAG: hypothetical protein GF409_07190, partial [Candidatus Omnitrophica bacterium]|nr:hypothetical protein [Candidatus Omnitrophota bacterium]